MLLRNLTPFVIVALQYLSASAFHIVYHKYGKVYIYIARIEDKDRQEHKVMWIRSEVRIRHCYLVATNN
jgi:hypothetical protein